MATAACMCFAFNSYAATKTKQTKSNTSTKPVVVNNKTSQFDEVFSDLGAKTADTTSADLAERVRQQRALLDGKGNSQSVTKASGVTGANACDATLRKCMAEKCGSDFTKCAKDSTAIWGDKMDSCRRKTKCTGHEYSLLAPEILADRDFNERMSYYNSVISCGNRYNSCIFAECGTMLEKCLSKSDGDRAVSKCAPVAKDCKEQDSGMAARVMSVFGDLRTVATAQAEKDEKRLYELRDLMRNQCNRLGAVFDERTLDCVYTVNFFAGDNTSTPTSSKKLYAGDSFQCNANWFGIDVTTFKENAYRRTRAQTSASSAMMGAGVGVAAGLLSSGAIDRALDTQRAEKAAKEECQNSGYTWEKGACNKDKPYTGNKNNNDDDDETGEEVTDDSGNNGQSGNENQQNLEQECTEKGRKYANGSCTTECLAEGYEYDSTNQTCNEHSNANELFLYCSGFEEESTCDTDKCEWNDNCVPKSAPRQNISTDETPTQTPVAPGKNVNISLQVTDKTQTVKLMAEIKCGTKTAKTPALGKKITLKNIASTETCVISATDCESKKFQAGVLAQGSQKFLVCPKIDECIANGGKWKNNKCSGTNVTATNSCELTPQAICGQGIQRGKCEWNGTKCVQKKNSSITPPSENPNRNVSNGRVTSGGSSSSTQSCNLDFTSLAKNLKLDTPIDLSNCNQNTAEYIQGIEQLKKACRSHNTTKILRTDKTVAYHRVEEPKLESGSFTCKSKDWFKLKEFLDGEPDEWDTETHPSDAECASTCKQIKPVTDPTKTYFKFPGEGRHDQCLKTCTPKIEEACQGLIGKLYGTKPVTKIVKIVYKLDAKDGLTYQCQFSYQM
ncbi:MAG: hypothetical protein IKS08_00320 [Alphaproteobacteria bacterium]|nr:hypothetical protein [Alphaproteobacteria bacterium]